MKQILDDDATELAEKIRNRQYSSLEVTNTYIEHLERANSSVNCISVDRYDIARQEAIDADIKLQNNEPVGRMHGVPISIKDCFHVAGMATTGGLIHRKDNIEPEDAEAVALLKQEGAIIIGKTNTPTLCFCQETDNKLYGRTNNPWDLSRSVGGSSGGEGALIALGGAAVGLGADIGGSIRFPSHNNGIVGFKSGNKQVSAIGNFPHVTIPEQDRMLGIGAMSKSVRDARLMNEILTGSKRKFVDLNAYEIIMPHKQEGIPLHETTNGLMEQLRAKLIADYKLSDELPPYFEQGALIWQELMSIDGAKHIEKILTDDGSKKNPTWEFVKEKVTKKSDFHHNLSWALIGARMFQPSEARLAEIRNLLAVGDQQISQYFSNKILIIPVYHEAAQKHGKLYGEIFSIRKTYKQYMPYIAYANVWGLPSLTLPIGTDEAGMPIGVQIICNVGNEDAIFQLGEWLEEEMYRYKRCTTYDA
ncbi:amidase [Paenibacillus endoradicis]|uniref:amidase n=1 Tax=Paenibacillus endoradicis TaxID=2972487 RepID=UPI0021595B34|nr:amidase [Paenibacillus endoradicis]MCR8657168.1 amidase [Paenibacillus endoradicis]